ncbi:Alvin_2107 family globule sulfur oxidation protein [Candidatus Venteria ishoeyi]|uniref:Uncharacterized protein n=1 Tax=Candidatus Venteria ishoeyi TaxID=1899563 RepID=A0A1H6FEG8_9GAMM|nr:hypothetical protein [Candidatus Venteria ishoeyi]MDM8546176.1 hypothetical protein [Candidatus Venteria ishoeyi]SEH08043.1 Uncharacterised protein [Candidatus Venteria ishoeyi]
MDTSYYNAVDKMEKINVDADYKVGWMSGYLHNPEREEQLLNEAYESGFEDGGNGETGNFDKWAK